MDLAALRRFGFLTLPNYSLIACANAIEALRLANRVSGRPEYAWTVVTLDGAPVPASNGLSLHPTLALDQADGFDLVLVCGGISVRHATGRSVTTALRRLDRSGVALGSLCTGSFALAEAGLLHGYRCAIHWEDLPAFREEFPDTEFVGDIYAIDRDRLTCTGGIAPLDMMLAVIAARLGPERATEISAQFIMERSRLGAERQPLVRVPPPKHDRVAAAMRLIEGRGATSLSIASAAAAVGVSPRQLERLFRQHLGMTPAAFAISVRLEQARALLRQTAMPVTGVAIACGFGSAAHFTTAFRNRFGHTPRAERALQPAAGMPLPPAHRQADAEHEPGGESDERQPGVA